MSQGYTKKKVVNHAVRVRNIFVHKNQQMSRLWRTSVSLFIHAVWKTQQQNMSCILSPLQLVAVTRGFDISLRRNPTRLPTCIKSKWALIILQFKLRNLFFTTEVNTYFNLFIKAREIFVLPLYTLHTVFDILFVVAPDLSRQLRGLLRKSQFLFGTNNERLINFRTMYFAFVETVKLNVSFENFWLLQPCSVRVFLILNCFHRGGNIKGRHHISYLRWMLPYDLFECGLCRRVFQIST